MGCTSSKEPKKEAEPKFDDIEKAADVVEEQEQAPQEQTKRSPSPLAKASSKSNVKEAKSKEEPEENEDTASPIMGSPKGSPRPAKKAAPSDFVKRAGTCACLIFLLLPRSLCFLHLLIRCIWLFSLSSPCISLRYQCGTNESGTETEGTLDR